MVMLRRDMIIGISSCAIVNASDKAFANPFIHLLLRMFFSNAVRAGGRYAAQQAARQTVRTAITASGRGQTGRIAGTVSAQMGYSEARAARLVADFKATNPSLVSRLPNIAAEVALGKALEAGIDVLTKEQVNPVNITIINSHNEVKFCQTRIELKNEYESRVIWRDDRIINFTIDPGATVNLTRLIPPIESFGIHVLYFNHISGAHLSYNDEHIFMI